MLGLCDKFLASNLPLARLRHAYKACDPKSCASVHDRLEAKRSHLLTLLSRATNLYDAPDVGLECNAILSQLSVEPFVDSPREFLKPTASWSHSPDAMSAVSSDDASHEEKRKMRFQMVKRRPTILEDDDTVSTSTQSITDNREDEETLPEVDVERAESFGVISEGPLDYSRMRRRRPLSADERLESHEQTKPASLQANIDRKEEQERLSQSDVLLSDDYVSEDLESFMWHRIESEIEVYRTMSYFAAFSRIVCQFFVRVDCDATVVQRFWGIANTRLDSIERREADADEVRY